LAKEKIMNKLGMYTIVAILIGSSLLAACGQASAPSANPGAPTVQSAAPGTAIPTAAEANPVAVRPGNCTILSKDEAGTVLGQTVTEVRNEAKGTICAYQTEDLIFELNFLNTGGQSAVQYIKTIQEINPDGELVPGLGDEALYNSSPAYRILYVRKGDSVYTFGIRSDPASQVAAPENIPAMEKTLAELLLSHLP
jgi:hypothetical protein